jgi:signal transduction histidine kinase
LIGASSSLAIALQYRDYIWATSAVVYAIVCAACVLAAGYLVWFVAGKRLSTPILLALAVFLGCLAAQTVDILLSDALGMEHPGKSVLYRLSLARGSMLWWGVAAAAWYTLKKAELRAAEVAQARLAGDELRARMAEARLKALQAQVEPHFLFNTLANVKSLYRRDPERGRRMLDRFVDYLQAALPRVRQATTTLEQELQLAHAYLDIQQLRIGGRLTFAIEVPAEIAQLQFPALMLLTLVENAIKHGIAPQLDGGTIMIRALVEGGVLRIEVRDTGVGLREIAGKGMGLANVRARLSALFGAGARLVIEPNAPHGVVAAIEIPQ